MFALAINLPGLRGAAARILGVAFAELRSLAMDDRFLPSGRAPASPAVLGGPLRSAARQSFLRRASHVGCLAIAASTLKLSPNDSPTVLD